MSINKNIYAQLIAIEESNLSIKDKLNDSFSQGSYSEVRIARAKNLIGYLPQNTSEFHNYFKEFN